MGACASQPQVLAESEAGAWEARKRFGPPHSAAALCGRACAKQRARTDSDGTQAELDCSGGCAATAHLTLHVRRHTDPHIKLSAAAVCQPLAAASAGDAMIPALSGALPATPSPSASARQCCTRQRASIQALVRSPARLDSRSASTQALIRSPARLGSASTASSCASKQRPATMPTVVAQTGAMHAEAGTTAAMHVAAIKAAAMHAAASKAAATHTAASKAAAMRPAAMHRAASWQQRLAVTSPGTATVAKLAEALASPLAPQAFISHDCTCRSEPLQALFRPASFLGSTCTAPPRSLQQQPASAPALVARSGAMKATADKAVAAHLAAVRTAAPRQLRRVVSAPNLSVRLCLVSANVPAGEPRGRLKRSASHAVARSAAQAMPQVAPAAGKPCGRPHRSASAARLDPLRPCRSELAAALRSMHRDALIDAIRLSCTHGAMSRPQWERLYEQHRQRIEQRLRKLARGDRAALRRALEQRW